MLPLQMGIRHMITDQAVWGLLASIAAWRVLEGADKLVNINVHTAANSSSIRRSSGDT